MSYFLRPGLSGSPQWIGFTMLIFLNLVTPELRAQGCSDAGFCTIGNLAANRNDTLRDTHKLSVMLPVGIGDESVVVFTPAVQYDHSFSNAFALQVKLTANYAAGNLGTAVGLGDVYVTGIKTWYRRNQTWSFTLGSKLPLQLGSLTNRERSLPMQYQSSLGTFDIIAGIAWQLPRWSLAAGYQQPFTGTNGNTFLPVYWDEAEAANYPPGNDFRRRGDVLLRATYQLRKNSRSRWNTGILAIYHLAEDTYIDANVSNDPIRITGSRGLTLNATLAAQWNLTPKVSMGFTAGIPFVVRDVRPDGLTRAFVLSPECIIKL